MKKLFAFFAILFVSVTANATQFTEGESYKVLDLPHSDGPLVTEYFSFYCPHCYEFEPLLKHIVSKLPKGTQFEKNHVSFMGGPMGFQVSKAYATMVELNVTKKMIPMVFDAIHKEGLRPENVSDIKSWFLEAGVSSNDFDSTFNSFTTDSMAREFDMNFRKAGLTGVPSVIVNGKYLIKPSGIESIDDYIDLVDYLLKK